MEHPDDMLAVYIDGHLIEMSRESYDKYMTAKSMDHRSFHKFVDEDGSTYGSFEVFEVTDRLHLQNPETKEEYPKGWYWWPCFEGCLPDGDASGPFNTREDAINDAQYG